ncbi:MAG: tRNA (adenosine(37)-N6)-threonylcarbamoyltransferase complex ATPase subunit type 1 TsaE [Bacteroidetes bacterium]|nr:tRNA (adenosine(37)-N6)-threonylcarbamoyltransferase complex ATPase subunit type 1 TsaE [Bacteroidota bacterium]|tara:strand:- start:68 stop:487 length:420 start_codon:yes stop_codon:yes gene_type:complete
MKNQIIIKSVEELNDAAKKLLEAYPDNRLFAFNGSMGAGKTTFIKSICAELGVHEDVVSPTFSIVNEYISDTGEAMYHFDFYRIKKKEEILDIGSDDYFYSGSYCFMEWPELVEELLPESIVYISIKENIEDGSRIIEY